MSFDPKVGRQLAALTLLSEDYPGVKGSGAHLSANIHSV